MKLMLVSRHTKQKYLWQYMDSLNENRKSELKKLLTC